MTFEQPAELDRLLGIQKKQPGEIRCELIKLFLPFIIFIDAIFVELLLLRLWILGEFNPWSIVIVGVVVPALMLTGILAPTWFSDKGKTTITIGKRGISIAPWKRIKQCWIVDARDDPRYSVFTVEYLSDRKRTRRRAIVLDKTQRAGLLAELTLSQQQYKADFPIETLAPPPIIPARPVSNLATYLVLPGMFCLFNGIPMIIAQSSENGDTNTFSPAQQQKLHEFVRNHFTSPADFNHFVLTAGIILTTIGGLLYLAAMIVIYRARIQKPITPA